VNKQIAFKKEPPNVSSNKTLVRPLTEKHRHTLPSRLLAGWYVLIHLAELATS